MRFLEIVPFGINTTLVEPCYFRTELLEPASTTWAENSIEAYSSRNAELRPAWQGISGKQPGAPGKLAEALIKIASETKPPKRWLAGADAISEAERKINELQEQINAYRDLSSSLAYEEG